MVERYLIQALVAGSEGRGLKRSKEDLMTAPGILDAGTLGAVDVVHIQAKQNCSSFVREYVC